MGRRVGFWRGLRYRLVKSSTERRRTPRGRRARWPRLWRAEQPEGYTLAPAGAGFPIRPVPVTYPPLPGTTAQVPDLSLKNSNPKTSKPDVAVATQARLPTRYGDLVSRVCVDSETGAHHMALIMGRVDDGEPVLLRIHSECLTGDVFGSLRCDCGLQLDQALSRIAEEGRGILLYLRQEGRGIGLFNKIRAYALQDDGLDTVEANEHLGFPADARDYGIAARMLESLGAQRLRLLTNNPRKLAALEDYGLEVVERVPLVIPPSQENEAYLATKRSKLGHLLAGSGTSRDEL